MLWAESFFAFWTFFQALPFDDFSQSHHSLATSIAFVLVRRFYILR